MTNCIYDTRIDFPNGLNIKQLVKEIRQNMIGKKLIRISVKQYMLTAVFQTELSTSDHTSMNTIITNHIPTTQVPKTNVYPVYALTTETTNKNYTKVAIFKYEGSKQVGPIISIEVLAYQEIGASSYSIRVIDQNNSKNLIAEKTNLTNTEVQVIDLGTITNVPSDATIIRVEVKRDDIPTKKIYLEGVNIYYSG